jgi:hypothetical protein
MTMNDARAAVVRGVVAGLVAGVPQVAIVQVAEKPLGLPANRADIGPRFVERIADHLGESLPPAAHWGLAALFHFAYSAGWGAFYGLVDALVRPPPAVAAPLLGGLIYTLAFSRWGAGTQTGTEPHPDRRHWRQDVLHWTAALSFSVTTALTYAWLCRRAGGGADARPAAVAHPRVAPVGAAR